MRAKTDGIRRRATARHGLGCLCVLALLAGARGAEDADIPSAAPDDEIMASPADVEETAAWAFAAFTGRRAPARAAGVGLALIHISEPTRLLSISYAVLFLKKKN